MLGLVSVLGFSVLLFVWLWFGLPVGFEFVLLLQEARKRGRTRANLIFFFISDLLFLGFDDFDADIASYDVFLGYEPFGLKFFACIIIDMGFEDFAVDLGCDIDLKDDAAVFSRNELAVKIRDRTSVVDDVIDYAFFRFDDGAL